MRRWNHVALLLLFPLTLTGYIAAQPACLIETGALRWEITADAHSAAFLDTATGTDLLAPAGRAPFCSIRVGAQSFPATAAARDGDVLRVDFGGAGASAAFRIETFPDYFTLTVTSATGADIEELTLFDVPLTLAGTLDDTFAACALARNLQTNVPEVPGPNKRLHALACKRFGLEGASAAVAACPMPRFRDTLKAVVSASPELPHHLDASVPPVGGPWALDAEGNRGSYLFDFGALTEETVDKWVAMVHDLGLNQIDFHTGSSLRFGDLRPNPKLFPNGRASVKAVIDKLHAAGIMAGLHTYAFFMAKDSKYVSPKPDPRLGFDTVYTLSAPLDAAADAVPVNESMVDVSLVTGFFARNSVTLRIEEELITFSGMTKEAPFQFTGCTRGACGTTPATHPAGAQAYKLKECFGLFAPDADSTLLEEISANTAETFNECGFDMIYLDALDGEDILAGANWSWHYGSKFVFDIAKRLEKPALFEMSTFHHHLWFVRARMGAWDHPARSHKRFIDLHCAANNQGAGMFLPMNLGWWAVKTWQGGTAAAYTEPTYSDDIEYLLCKALGNGMGLSLMGVNPDNIGANPLFQRLLPLFKTYENLRHAGTVPESIKEKLRVPGDEYTLETDAAGAPVFRPVEYLKHKVDSPESAQWTVENRFDGQSAQLRIEALMSVKADPAPVTDFADLNAFNVRQAAQGIQTVLEASPETTPDGAPAIRFSAVSTRSERTGSWAKAGRTFSPTLNIADKPALGVWVHGDGKGELLNLQVLSAGHNAAGGTGDHYITVDFTGWRHFTLVEFEGGRINDFQWPYGNSYSNYREHVDFGAIESFSLWYNDIPAGETVSCALGPITAMPLESAPLSSPKVTIGGREIVFPVTLESGTCLEFRTMDDCALYGPTGELIANVTPQGEQPLFAHGDNEFMFACDASKDLPARARVTAIATGEPLEE